MAKEAADLCVYFGINKLPKFMVLRPDTDKFYLYPGKEIRTFHQFNHFAMTSYYNAFVQDEFPRNYYGWEENYMMFKR